MPYSDPFFRPRSEEGPATMSLWVFDGKPEDYRAVQREEDLMYWYCIDVIVVVTRGYSIDFFTVD